MAEGADQVFSAARSPNADKLGFGLGNPLTTSNDAPDKSRMRFLGVSIGIFLKMLFWKIYGFSKITFTSINVLKKTFSRSWSRYRLSHTLHCIFAHGK